MTSRKSSSLSPPKASGPAADLDVSPKRRATAEAHAALLGRTAAKVALELPFGADVDDFRRVLVAEALSRAGKRAKP
jgi:hypothetical protein